MTSHVLRVAVLGAGTVGAEVVRASTAPEALAALRSGLFDLAMQQKQLVGTIFGSANPRYDVPRLLSLYQKGDLKLDELITNTYTLEEINQGYQDMRDGKNLRGVILY